MLLRRRPRDSPVTLVILVALVAVLSRSRVAWAHEFRPAVLTISVAADGGVEAVLRVPADTALRGRSGAAEAIEPRLPAPCEWTGPARELGAGRVWRGACGPGGPRGTLTIDGLTEGTGEVVVEVRVDGRSEVHVVRAGAASVVLGERGSIDAGGYVGLGVAHILEGADHLLFVAGLVLLTLRTAAPWRRRALALLATLTAFTAAHSVTLAAATLGLLRVPAAPVEACIALSIAFLARALVLPPAPGTPWGLAFGCGLLHGLGFAGALAEVGLPADGVARALLAFNIGVELGQAGFAAAVAAVFVVATAPLRERGRRWLSLGAGYALGAVAMAWTIARVVAP